MVEKISSRGNVIGEMSCQGSLFRGSVQSGIVLRESGSLGSVHEEVLVGKCLDTNLLVILSQRNCVKSSKKEENLFL